MPGKKFCSSCREEKSPDEFYKNKNEKDGLTRYCIACTLERGRKFRQERRERRYGNKIIPLGKVYFVIAESVDLVKIGYTADDVEKRFYSLSRMSPVPLKLLAVYPATFQEEADLHREFAAHFDHGEWYKMCDDIRRCIANLDKRFRRD